MENDLLIEMDETRNKLLHTISSFPEEQNGLISPCVIPKGIPIS